MNRVQVTKLSFPPDCEARCTEICIQKLAEWALAQIDLRRVTLSPVWNKLDSVKFRKSNEILSTHIRNQILEELALSESLRAQLNGGVELSQKYARFRLRTSHFKDIHRLAQRSLNAPWPALWDELSKQLLQIRPENEEWLRLNRLLVAQFFQTTRLPNARSIHNVFAQFRESLLGARGCLTRLPVQKLARPVTRIAKRELGWPTSGISDLQDISARAVADLSAGGLLVRRVDRNAPGVPPYVNRARRMHFSLQDANASVLVAVSSAEQILRCLDHRKEARTGFVRTAKIVAGLKKAGILTGDSLTASEFLLGDLRGQISHGALVDTESAFLECIWSQRFLGLEKLLDVRNVPTAAELASAAWHCAENIVSHARNTGMLDSIDWSWTSVFGLEGALSDVLPYCEVIDSNTDRCLQWAARIKNFLRIFAPVVVDFFEVFNIGWISSGTDRLDDIDRSWAVYYAMLVFETFYRLVVHLVGVPVLEGALTDPKYRMLDQRGLASREILNKLLCHHALEEREQLINVLSRAITIRNALLHGAFRHLDPIATESIGRILWKSFQILYDSAEHHLIAERAYYGYLGRQNAGRTTELEDWYRAAAEHDRWVSQQLRSTST